MSKYKVTPRGSKYIIYRREGFKWVSVQEFDMRYAGIEPERGLEKIPAQAAKHVAKFVKELKKADKYLRDV